MKNLFSKYWKTYLFFLATVGVAFLVSMSIIKPQPPHAGVVEADESEVKSATIEKPSSSYNFPELKNIPKELIPEPQVVAGSFLYKTPQDLIRGLDIKVDKKAIVVESGLPSKLGVGGYNTYIFEPQKVFYNYGGGTQGVMTTWAKDVSTLLEELRDEKGITVGTGDIVKPARETKIVRSDLFVLEITPVQDTEVVKNEPILFRTVITKDDEMELGKKVIEQPGRNGVRTLKYAVHREMVNDKWIETGRQLTSSEVTKEAVDQQESHGTKIITYGTGKATFYESKVAAHKTLPFGTKVEVVNLANGKSVVVTIGDRGPFGPGRIIDLPTSDFAKIAPLGQGIANVEIRKYYSE